MTHLNDSSVICTACDRQYRWKEQYAGKKMKCKCGEVITMPEQQPEPLDDLYEVEPSHVVSEGPSQHCPSCGKRLKPGAVLCIGCGYNLQTGDVVATAINAPAAGSAANAPMEEPVGGMYANAMASRRRQTSSTDRKSRREENRDNVLTPLGIMAASMLTLFVYMVFLADTPASPIAAMVSIFAMVIFVTPVLLIGLYIASSILGVGYGQLHTGLLKLVAVYLAPEACHVLLNMVESTGALGWFVSLILYYCLLMFLFELDPDEAFYTMIILAITKVIAMIFISTVVMGMILAGIGGL